MRSSTSLVALFLLSCAACSVSTEAEGTPPTSANESAFTALSGFYPVPATGCASAVATSAHETWILGCEVLPSGDHGIYRLVGNAWQRVPGFAKSIAISSKGTPWVVNAAGEVYGWNGSSFAPPAAPGCATAIGVGPLNTPWILGCAPTSPGNHGVYFFTGSQWQSVLGEGKSLTVASDGTPWIIKANGAVLRWNGGGFLPGFFGTACAREIGVGNHDEAWIIGCESAGPDGNVIKGWTGTAWQAVPGAAKKISVNELGVPTVVNNSGTVFYGN